MVWKYASRFVQHMLWLSFAVQSTIAVVMVDDTSPDLQYSNSGPSWWGSNFYNGQGKYVAGQVGSERAYDFTWHESLGDGASVSYTFTGTHVSLISTICNSVYNTTVDFYIDGQYMTSYQHLVPYVPPPTYIVTDVGPTTSITSYVQTISDVQLQVTIGDFPNLPPAQHTFKAVSVGSNSLFVVDAISYDPSDAVVATSSSNPLGSSSVGSMSSTSDPSDTTGSAPSTLGATSASSGTPISTPPGSNEITQPVGVSINVPASDSQIIYSPPGAWKQNTNAKRATSCSESTMISSTVNSSLSYNFMGTSIQVYTVSAPNGGNYTISIDGKNQGTYSTYDPSAQQSTCPLSPLYSTTALANTQHTLVLVVQGPPSGSTRNTVQFAGFRTTPLVNGNPSSSSPSIAAIVGGVIGGIIGLVLLLLLVLLWINHRQRRASKEQGVTQSPDSPLQSRFSEDPFLSERRRRSAQPSWVAGSSASMLSRMPTTMPQHNRQQPVYDYTAPPPHTYNAVPPSHADDASTDVDRLTYYTLPSYHENVRQRPGARDLSEADVDAISRRLVEVMQGQVEQSGGDPNQLHGVVPPGNLIDHLVEEQLQPQAI